VLNGRTVALALAAVVVCFVVGAIAGPGVGLATLGGLLAGALFWAATVEWQRRIEQRNRLKEVHQAFAPPALMEALPVAYYLRPEEAVVPFRPRPELDELMAWSVSEAHTAVRLVTGEAGAGKTRLVQRLINDLAADGWQRLQAPRDSKIDAAEAARVIGQPCVLVVDYAEARGDLARVLNDLAINQDRPDLRVLLLARSAGEWWRGLLDTTERQARALLEAHPPMALGPVLAAGGPQELFDEAVTAFAQRMGVPRPDATLTLTETDPVVLVVHAAALLAVVDSASGTQPSDQAVSGRQVIEALLQHEARYWAASAAGRGLELDVSVLRLAVALGCMIGAASETAAIALLARVPDLDSAERRGRVARWLHDLYPTPCEDDAHETEWLGPLRPDRLAEQLVIGELATRPELIPPLFSELEDARVARAASLLVRAARTDDRAPGLFRSAVQVISARPVSHEALQRVAADLPYPSSALAAPAAVIFRRLVDGSTDDAQRARYLINLGNRLGELDRRGEALAAVEEAKNIFCELARNRPDPFLYDYAWALNNRAGLLALLGQRLDESRADITQAVGIFRELAQDHPGTFLPAVASSLFNLSRVLTDSGSREDALAAINEATGIYEQLIQDRPDAFLPQYLTAIEQAITIYRPLVQARPNAYRPAFIQALNTYANVLSTLGRRAQAAELHREAAAEEDR
jgi:tetratricopeptide (TPR) repeat protein